MQICKANFGFVIAMAAFFPVSSSWAADTEPSPTPAMAEGLWSISTAPSGQPDKARSFQQCISHDPAYLAQLNAYAEKIKGAATLKVDRKITNEVRTQTSLSYDYESEIMLPSGMTMNQTGSRQYFFPDDKHRTERETATATGSVMRQPVKTDRLTTWTWIGADCGSVKPIMPRSDADPQNPSPNDFGP